MFDLDTMYLDAVSEGEQADAYKKRKEEEARQREEAEKERLEHRRFNHGGTVHKSTDWKNYEKDHDRYKKASDMVHSDLHNRIKKKEISSINNASKQSRDGSSMDAANRHLRRHPSKESVLIDLMEDIQFADIMVNDIESDID